MTITKLEALEHTFKRVTDGGRVETPYWFVQPFVASLDLLYTDTIRLCYIT